MVYGMIMILLEQMIYGLNTELDGFNRLPLQTTWNPSLDVSIQYLDSDSQCNEVQNIPRSDEPGSFYQTSVC